MKLAAFNNKEKGQKLMKKFLAAFLCAAVALSLSACNDNTETPDDDKDKSSVSDSKKDNDNSTDESKDNSSEGENNSEENSSGEEEAPSNPAEKEEDYVVPTVGIWDILPEIDETPESELVYSADAELGGVAVTNYTGASPKLRIPDTLGGQPVVKVDLSACDYKFTEVIMPETTKEFAFSSISMQTIEYMNFPGAIEKISRDDFKPSNALYIGEGVKEFEAYAFEGVRLATVNIPNSVKTIGTRAFYDSGISSITIGSGVESIGDGAFRESRIQSIIIPGNVKTIGDNAFYRCYYLQSVALKKGVQSVGYMAFAQCQMLAEIEITGTLTDIGDYAFSDTYWLDMQRATNGPLVIVNNSLVNGQAYTDAELTIPKNVTQICGGAFNSCSGLTKVVIPEGVKEINRDAFAGCYNLSDVTIPKSVTQIGRNAFEGTPWLEDQRKDSFIIVVNDILIDGKNASGTITIPSNVTKIADGAFNSAGIKNVTLPDGITYIGDMAFAYCGGLQSINIPNTVKYIGGQAFRECGLPSVDIPDSVTYFGADVFYGCYYLKTVTYKGNNYYDMNELAALVNGNPALSSG